MSYRLTIPRSVIKRMKRIPPDACVRVDEAILKLAENLRPPGCAKLGGREEWRIRIVDYRVVYGIDDEEQVIEVLNVAHRKDVYRQG